MRTYRTQKVTAEQECLESIQCNVCGVDIDARDEKADEFEGLRIDITGGYWSKFLGDMVQYGADVCEECLVKWFATFKVPVERKELW